MFPQCAKDPVKDVKDSLEVLEENIKVEGDLNTNSVSKPLAIKRRGSKHKTSVPATIQIICKQDGKLMNDIQAALETTLRSNLGTVTFISLNDISKIDDKKMLIILCIVATRIASDAASAMQDIKNPANAALVIIDIDEAHELSNTHNLTGDAFKNLRGIYGLSFMKSNGSFPNCDMNDKSINGLSSFCKQQPYSEKL
ncbi:uncharacterized protein LOC132744335 [Ruditapes philippinarum]|uniref:uncharacterized protein LOC132744335 n=1 Tax=Ruditapes philippinarum TaxID=129788 RepID=UPI00295B7A87|nr:uncharacterized protein LOC132744335 [Ruditapes philippinarum]